jgi:hypothetical protein
MRVMLSQHALTIYHHPLLSKRNHAGHENLEKIAHKAFDIPSGQKAGDSAVLL